MSAPRPTSQPPTTVVGRDQETAEIATVLDRAGERLAGLVVAGPAGMGKTTLLRWALAEAERRGRRLLVAHPSESESQLPFGGLADLLDAVERATIDDLPEPQRRALKTALRRADGDPDVDPLAISQAILGVVRELAARGPLVIAVDDVPWLDAPTARVLEYVVRRLAAEPVAVIAAVRTEARTDAGVEPAPDPALVRSIPPEALDRVDVGPLSVEAIGMLVAGRLGRAPSRSVARRIRDLAGGNPFHALELARAIARAGASHDGDAIAVPDSLRGLVRGRLEQLTPRGREAALVAAAATRPTRSLVRAALEADGAPGDAGDHPPGLDELIGAGIVHERGDGRLDFDHPLLAWAAYGDAPAERRLDAHRRLALAAADPDERARHLAMTAVGPSEEVAATLSEAASRAHGRGAPESARDLELEALRLTPPGSAGAIRLRTLAAAEYAIQAADGAGARALLERLIEVMPAGPERARPLALLADIRSGDDWEAKLELLEAALAESEPDGPDRAEIEVVIAVAHWTMIRDLPAGLAHGREGLAVAERVGDPAVLVRAITALAYVETFCGEPGTLERLQPALDLEPQAHGLRLLFLPSYDRPLILHALDRPEEARAGWLEVLERAERLGDEDSRPLALINLGATYRTLGEWAQADRFIGEGEAAAELLGHDATRALVASYRAHLEAWRGNEERARAAAARVIELAGRTHLPLAEAGARAALAELDLSLGDARAAWTAVRPAADRFQAAGVPHSPTLPVVPVAAEAAALAGDLDEAEHLVERILVVASRLDHASSLRAHHRGRALVAAARGDLDGALAASEEQIAQAGRIADPFELARSRLIHAEILRRLRQRARARTEAAEALAAFEGLGARLWAERARSELARAGQPVAADGPAALTPTQREVAALVAAGRTNREVAEALFMSPHTVEAHLTAIYRALGIRSRTDLARVLATPDIERPKRAGDGGAAPTESGGH